MREDVQDAVETLAQELLSDLSMTFMADYELDEDEAVAAAREVIARAYRLLEE